MSKLFGTDGIRGEAGRYPLDSVTIVKIGKASAGILKASNNKVVIGKDTRATGDEIETSLSEGILSSGMDIDSLGIISTPGVAYYTNELNADFGISITASHNPAKDNGIKLFTSPGYKISDDVQSEIEKLVLADNFKGRSKQADTQGGNIALVDSNRRYIDFVKSTTLPGIDLSNLKIVLDCANGAVYDIAPIVFRELGAKIRVINDEPDGYNINLNCGATTTQRLRKIVLETKSDLGISFDGDADRTVLIDEKGNEIDGDRIMAICALDMVKSNNLRNKAIIVTRMSNFGLDLALREAGCSVIRIPKVGDKYVVEAMREREFNLGGEQSGHVIFSDLLTTGDGLITAIQVLNVMTKASKKLSELAACMQPVPQLLHNVLVKSNKDIADMPKVNELIEEATRRLAGSGDVWVRYSGTESSLRIMVQGKNRSEAEELISKLESAVIEELGDREARC